MTDREIEVLIKGYVGDIEISQELIDQLKGFWEDAYQDGYKDGYEQCDLEYED